MGRTDALEELDDAELMAEVRRGRAEALALLFDRHHGPLYGFLYRMTGHSATSEDLAQEAFLRVMRFASSFKPGAPFRPWLYRIARNLLADHRARVRPETSLETHGGDLLAGTPCAHASLEAAQDRQRLNQALERLPLEKRELLILSRNADLSYQDLATLYDCSPGAVKVRVHRALQELREHFFASPARPSGRLDPCPGRS